jgi:transcriptional regulator with GAF, ATPase, and Fis domain
MRHAAPETIVFTDPVANAIDQAQYGADLGPCLDAFRRREVVSVPSMVSADRWPAFRDAALAHDVRSSLSLPLVTGEAHIGALNLYGRQDQAFNAVPPEAATLFARQAAAAVWVADTIASTRAMIGHLEVAVESRDMIGMAKGIIMVNEKVTPDAAFILLQTASQHRNVKLRDIAAEVVETGLTPS